MPIATILLTIALLALGVVLRYIIPYLIAGFTAVGDSESSGWDAWKEWPKWEWRYMTSSILAMMAYGVTFLVNPATFLTLAAMAPLAIVLAGYAGTDISDKIVKPFQAFRRKLPERDEITGKFTS